MHLYSVAMGMSMAFMGRWVWQARALMPLYRKSRRRRPVPFPLSTGIKPYATRGDLGWY